MRRLPAISLCFLTTFLLLVGCGALFKSKEARLNDLVGPEKWQGLSDYLVENRSFVAPPVVMYSFFKDGRLCSEASGGGTLTNPSGALGETCSTWAINPTGEYFMAAGSIYRSFRFTIHGNGAQLVACPQNKMPPEGLSYNDMINQGCATWSAVQ